MVRRNRSQSQHNHTTTLPIRPQASSPQSPNTRPITGSCISTHSHRSPCPAGTNALPHQSLPTKGSKSPSTPRSIEQYRSARSATRQKWTESQRRRIAENEALLRQLAEITPELGSLSIKTHLPRGNDLTVEEQIAIIYESVTPRRYSIIEDMLLKRPCEETSNNMDPISPNSSANLDVWQNEAASQASKLE